MNSATDTRTSGRADASHETDANQRIPTIEEPGRDGSTAMLFGGALLAVALGTARRRRGLAVLSGVAGVALLGVGARRRRAAGETDGPESDRSEGASEKTVSDEARVHTRGDLGAGRNADESRGVDQSGSEPNPRGVSDTAEVEDDDGGKFDFVEGKEPGEHRETHLEDEGAHDARLHPESDDEPTEIDLSEAAMADEASEAAGPHPEQAFPASEGTEPEPTAPEAPERTDEEGATPADANTEGAEASPDSRGDDEAEEAADEQE